MSKVKDIARLKDYVDRATLKVRDAVFGTFMFTSSLRLCTRTRTTCED